VGTPYYYVFLNPAPGEHLASQSTFTEELQLQGNAFDSKLMWQAGAYLEVSDPIGYSAAYTAIFQSCTNVQALQCTNAFGAAGSISGSYMKTYYNNKGFYGQATYKLTDQLSVTGGLRYTIDKQQLASDFLRIRFTGPGNNVPTFFCNDTLRFRGPANPLTGAPTPLQVTDKSQCHEEFRTKSEKPTWLIGLDYKPAEDVLLYGKYARGYRQGGLNPLNIGLEEWAPEKLDSYEVGAKASFNGALKGNINVAAFYNELQNQQLQANLVAKPGTGIVGGNAIVNAGKSRIQGIEVEASLRPFTRLRLDVGYTYLDTKLVSQIAPVPDPDSPFSSISPRGIVGEALTLSPKNKVSATANYTLPLDASIGEITLGATYTHTDSQVADFNSPLGRLPATDLLNLNLNWNDVAAQPIDLSLFATNVTKEVYPASIGSNYGSGGFETYIMAPPRMYGLRLRYRFGS
jgi:iron complex outermembrane receptor protein